MPVGTHRQKLTDSIHRRLGESSIPGFGVGLEIGHDQIEEAIDLAFRTYRQRAENAHEESWMVLTLHLDQQEYVLPTEVQDVLKIFRRGYGRLGGSGSQFDAFEQAFSNMYFLQANNVGGLATYEIYSQYMDMAGKMFGMYANFKFHNATKRLIMMEKPRDEEEVLLWVYNHKPDEVILQDVYATPWVQNWALAECKEMLGQIRSKFSQVPGPGGAVTLNGTDLLAQAAAEKQQLLAELAAYVDGSQVLGISMG